MDKVTGTITHLRVYQEEGGRDLALSFSKILWCGVWVLLPICLFRLLNLLFGVLPAIIGVLFLATVIRLFGPFNLVMVDELLSRIFPSVRSAVRMGVVRIHDFRLLTEAGRQMACLLKGDLIGAGPLEGDLVELEGRWRQGTFRVRRGVNDATGSSLAPRSLRSGWVLAATAGLMATLLLYLAGIFDELIYIGLEKLLGPAA